MSQIWKNDKVIPVTLVKATPNIVICIKEKEKTAIRRFRLVLIIQKRN